MWQLPPPVPIIVVGHFNDARAADCRQEARQLCRDRLVIDRIVQLEGVVMPTPLVPPVPTPTAEPTEVAEVDGIQVMTVSEALAAHAAGTLPDGRAAIRGYWSNGETPHQCIPPLGYGDLEMPCAFDEFGITERDEPIVVFDDHGNGIYAAEGPFLVPFFPEGVDLPGLFGLPIVDGRRYPPVPIIVLGHFDDPRSEDCRPVARQRCRDRLVIDLIVQFEPGVLPTPGATLPTARQSD